MTTDIATTAPEGIVTVGDEPREERKFVPASQAFGWDKGGLVIRSAEVLGRYNIDYLSPSTAKAMDGCPARWAAEKAMPEREDPFGPAELGTSAHAVMEELYQLPGSERTEERAMNILRVHSMEQWPGRDEATYALRTKWIAEVYNAMVGLWQIEDPTTVVVKQTELRCDGIEIVGVPFKGFIDRVDYVPDGFRVVDYKSGKKMPQNITRFGDDHGDQIRLYAEVMRVIEGKMPAEGLLYYTRGTVAKSRTVPLNKTKMNEVLRKFQTSWRALNTYVERAEFPTKTSALCGWCSLVNACPSAQVDGKVPRKDGIPSKTDLGIPILRTFEASELTTAARRDANRLTPPPSMDLDFGPTVDTGARPEEHAEHEPTPVPVAIENLVDPLDTPTAAAPVEPFTVPDAVVNATPGASDAGSAQADAAHLNPENPTEMENDMLAEDKPWEEIVNGALNPNSYAAGAVFGLVNLAYEQIKAADVKPTKDVVDGLAATFAHVVAKVQETQTGIVTFQDGIHTRLRGALHTVVEANPLPFGSGRVEWDAWVDLAIKHVFAIAQAAIRLHTTDVTGSQWTSAADAPWSALAAGQPADDFQTAAA